MDRRQALPPPALLALFLATWVGLVGVGFWKLFDYADSPGASAERTQDWPAGSPVARDNDRPTLLLFLHPHCSCSAATLTELEKLLPAIRGKAQIITLFFAPQSKPLSWAQSSLWTKAHALPGVEVALDPDGREAERFGALTSGQTFYFSQAGKLLFQGGITPSRGHAGENAGTAAIHALTDGDLPAVRSTRTFGCALVERTRTLATKSP
jgi:hypothetical protein